MPACANGRDDARPWQGGRSPAGSHTGPQMPRAGGAAPQGGSQDGSSQTEGGASIPRRCNTGCGAVCAPLLTSALCQGGSSPPPGPPGAGVCLASSQNIVLISPQIEVPSHFHASRDIFLPWMFLSPLGGHRHGRGSISPNLRPPRRHPRSTAEETKAREG